MAPQSLQSPSYCKPAARWRHNCCNPLPTANLPLDGAPITDGPQSLQKALFTLQEHHLGANMGTTRSRGSYDLSPPPTKVSAQLAHRQLRKALFTLQERPLVADMGATWWQGSYGLFSPPTKVSTRLAHIQLRNSTFYPLGAPPGGRYGRHLVAR